MPQGFSGSSPRILAGQVPRSWPKGWRERWSRRNAHPVRADTSPEHTEPFQGQPEALLAAAPRCQKRLAPSRLHHRCPDAGDTPAARRAALGQCPRQYGHPRARREHRKGHGWHCQGDHRDEEEVAKEDDVRLMEGARRRPGFWHRGAPLLHPLQGTPCQHHPAPAEKTESLDTTLLPSRQSHP